MKWRKVSVVGASAYESENGVWRVVNPWGLDTPARRDWLIHERDGDGWAAHDAAFRTMREARAYVEELIA